MQRDSDIISTNERDFILKANILFLGIKWCIHIAGIAVFDYPPTLMISSWASRLSRRS